ncbi:MAG TPA: hypothetical protein PK137_04605 [Anaerolineaceae bacterium]|nr:hypothetical protein [Anaerolineaceae bacterium]HPL43110.1 hypothetical protein [Anaerolineaceae bacterium]
MAPEKKSGLIVNLPPKVKKAIAGGIVAASLATGCGVVVEALPPERPIITSTGVPTKDPETNTDPTQVNYELIPTPRVTETMINPPVNTPELTITQTSEVGLSVENIPTNLNFIDGRNVKEMASNVGIDANTGLEVAMNNEGNIVAYNLKTENKDLWVVNPLIEKGFKWNFDTNENGQYILHNALEEWKYKPYPIEGIKYVKSDKLPATFWDESHPVKEDEKYPWPSEGSLAVFDGEGDMLMYYSKYENAWWYAGYQSELPGNIIFRQSGSSLALTGIRYKPIDESVWTGPDLNDRWQEIRNSIDWLAYTRRTGNYISLENFSSRVANGEIFEYQSWLFDLDARDYKLVTLNNKTKFYIQYSIIKSGFVNGYEDLFNARYHGIEGLEDSQGILLNPDNSVSIVKFAIEEQNYKLKYPYNFFLYAPLGAFQPYAVSFLAASDSVQKEGIKIKVNDQDFYNILSTNEMLEWNVKLSNIDFNNYYDVGGELLLSITNPLIYPNIYNPHPYQKP